MEAMAAIGPLIQGRSGQFIPSLISSHSSVDTPPAFAIFRGLFRRSFSGET